MKNSLSTNSIIPLIASWKELRQAVLSANGSETAFPVSINGLHGSLPAFFISEWLKYQNSLLIHNSQYNGKIQGKRPDIIIFVATQKEADECESDLLTVLGDSAEIYVFPWWGMMPYRAAGKGSAVFGTRAGVLARLTQKNTGSSKSRVFIVSQRALLSPLPPPDYLKKQVFRIRKSQSLNIMELSQKLSDMGYLRVPKVGVRGEYAIRGEVVDIFMPGEERPDRLVFDFDTVEQIKSFDVETQSSKENKDSLLVYPMKEVLWKDDLVSKLEHVLEKQEKEGIVNNFAE
ncbi:MAG: transcription-repair coupling factor, partial [Treponema sp.]|nr:transcription-repair coupling factor [Treponema sp.]